MTSPPAPEAATGILPPPSPNGQAPPEPSRPAPELAPRPARTRISGARATLIAAFIGLVVVLVFVVQNPHAVSISFLGAHLRLPLGVSLLFAAVAGALLMAAAGTARITQLRLVMRRGRRTPQGG
jgi:lipopolysaccharide assembly protein A